MNGDLNVLSGIVVDECIRIHRELGPGVLESVYETVQAGALERRGLRVDRQVPVDIHYDGLTFAGAFRIDIRVERILILEIKSVEKLVNLHAKQLLTYLRLTDSPLGLLLDFSGETMKEGIRRVANCLFRSILCLRASVSVRNGRKLRCFHSKE